VLVAFNRNVQRIIMQMSVEDHNALIEVFDEFNVVLGADSACFHIMHGFGDVVDCNPVLEDDPNSESLLPQ
jgi:hypothetical protein